MLLTKIEFGAEAGKFHIFIGCEHECELTGIGCITTDIGKRMGSTNAVSGDLFSICGCACIGKSTLVT